MRDYSQFKEALEVSVKYNIKLSHISNLVSKGFTKVELLVNSDLIDFRFWGNHLHSQHFKPRESFSKESKLLHSQEYLGYALLNSCIDAENSTIDLGIPQTYKVILEVSGDSSYRCTISVPRATREKTSLMANPNGNYNKFITVLLGYLHENISKSPKGSVIIDGFRSARLQVFSDGKISVTFDGEQSCMSRFISLEDFYERSKYLENREGFYRALIGSCVSAEKSATGDIPKSYKVVCSLADNSDLKYEVE